MISNGLELNEERIKYMKENNLGISLSFDGIWNDVSRPMTTGQASFENIKKKRLT